MRDVYKRAVSLVGCRVTSLPTWIVLLPSASR